MEYFSFEEIKDYTREKARVKELMYIEKYKPVFNKEGNKEGFLKDPFYMELFDKRALENELVIDLGGFEL